MSVCVCVCATVCVRFLHVHVCVTDCAAPPALGIGVKREVFRLSGGKRCLTPIRSNEITRVFVSVCVCFCQIRNSGASLGGNVLTGGRVASASAT